MSFTEQRSIAVVCEGLWKIFGSRSKEAMAAVRDEGLSKQEVIDRYNCILAVRDVTFEIPRGEILCIMGLSGSGKSTLVRHLNRLIEPTAGSIKLDGNDIARCDPKKLRELRNSTISMVFQSFGLLPHRNLRDNVGFGLELRGMSKVERWRRADEAIALMGLSGWGDKFPASLSGGMQQRVGIARAMAVDSPILLMDEPFSALDPLIRRDLQDQFLAMSRKLGKTTLFITHDLDEAFRLGNRIAIMKDGAFVQVGTAAEIVAAPADDYVANFVSGLSRLNLLTADKLMGPVGADEQFSEAVAARPDTSFNMLVDLTMQAGKPVRIESGDGTVLGVVTKERLLSAIQEHGQRHA